MLGVLIPDLYERLVLSREKLLLAREGLFSDVLVVSLDGGFFASDKDRFTVVFGFGFVSDGFSESCD